ncbi:restriction endonuclease subunit S [Janthinobacterium agaricidamnosum]|uniref:Type I restriction modification DNA specificity domain protein n=1 Tax=Janthinobacterium agaricidamnosum NBRC 102515 = DSM 9628 TaxID=1349767 RepID=W0VDI8_9BURK|nr:restriction endonuclease subunit S [Janthinobacterium agaricidamnosum]CDG85740.1 type I restriction modification DNA specificity domain protein [Janthinobacterium agaricidamnosum NBRC 102515 = DSM 9628]
MKHPKTWIPKTVADVCEMRNGHGFGPTDWDTAGLPIIRIQNLNGGQKFDYFSGVPDKRWLVDPGQMLFSWAGTKGVSFGPTIWNGTRGVLNQHIFKVQPKENVDSEWLYWALKHVTDRIEAHSHGFKATLVHVKKSDIDHQPILVPPPGEQRRIARILSTWNQAIVASERLLASSRQHLTALLQQLLIKPAIRGDWPMVAISEISERVQRRADENEALPVLMISSGRGFVRQDEKYSRFMAGKSVENYIALDRGEFAYNKGNSKLFEFGCVFPLKSYERGVVPNVYVCFKLSKSLKAGFYEQLFRADYLHDQLGALVNTGVRNNGLLNIRPVDFFACQVPVPPLEEQQRIADVLEKANIWVSQHERSLELLNREKAALMSQLLTGKRRVKLPVVGTESQV